MFVVDRGITDARRFIINFPTKRHWRNMSIAIPALGCGNGGLDWATVRPLIEAACARIPEGTEFAPIDVTRGSLAAAQAVSHRQPEHAAWLDSLPALVAGFETPYSLELLATVHFAAAQEPTTADPTELTKRVAAWSLRKARLFTDEHVRLAAARLSERGLLSPVF
jgi:hypothetical protein